ncbi:MAG: hypothetical protein JO279_16365 [Verrucomicrobia bacterium]|nr:hypothetical protein [Verrucomicrobiota bacterium]
MNAIRCDQNGPPARREEGAYLNRYVTDEQRSRRPIATLWAAANGILFRRQYTRTRIAPDCSPIELLALRLSSGLSPSVTILIGGILKIFKAIFSKTAHAMS